MSPNQLRYQGRRRREHVTQVRRAAEITFMSRPSHLAPHPTVKQIAKRMGCSRRTIFRYRRDPNYRLFAEWFRRQWHQQHPVERGGPQSLDRLAA